MKNLLLIIVVLAIAITGCNQSKIAEELKEDPAVKFYKDQSPFYADNPEDSVGFYHNELLDYYAIKGISETTPDTTIVKWTSDYLEANLSFSNYDTLLNSSSFLNWLQNEVPNYTYASMKDTISAYEEVGYIPSSMREYYDSLYSYLNIFDSTSSDGYLIVLDSIKSLENTVSGISVADSIKEDFYRTSAIAKFSSKYWFEQVREVDAPYGNGNNDYYSRIPGWVGSDALGAVHAWGSGAGAWGVLVPGGPLAVIVGTAAVASAVSYFSGR